MAKLPPPSKVVVHWVDTEQVSVEDLTVIPNEEDRYIGALTVIEMNGKRHKAVVRLISSDKVKLNEMETKVMMEIERREQSKTLSEADKRTRKVRHRIVQPHAASDKAIASAIGEKVKAPPEQSVKVKEIKKTSKQSEKAKQNAQDDIDYRLLACKHRLFDQKGNSESDNASVSSLEVRSSHPVSTSKPSVPEDEAQTEDGYSDVHVDMHHDSDDPEHKINCDNCGKLYSAGRLSVPEFLCVLNSFLSSKDPDCDVKKFKYVEVLPIPNRVPKCELTKGSNVFISVADKNSIKSDSQGNPSNIVREGLLKLYGRDVMENMNVTALGSRKGSLGIKKEVRDALLAFANRNKRPQFEELTKVTFNRIMNRKKDQLRRTKVKGAPPQERKTSKKGQSKQGQGKQKKVDHEQAEQEQSEQEQADHEQTDHEQDKEEQAEQKKSKQEKAQQKKSKQDQAKQKEAKSCPPNSPWKIRPETDHHTPSKVATPKMPERELPRPSSGSSAAAQEVLAPQQSVQGSVKNNRDAETSIQRPETPKPQYSHPFSHSYSQPFHQGYQAPSCSSQGPYWNPSQNQNFRSSGQQQHSSSYQNQYFPNQGYFSGEYSYPNENPSSFVSHGYNQYDSNNPDVPVASMVGSSFLNL